MQLNRLSPSDIATRMGVLIEKGKSQKAQEVLTKLGYIPEKLDAGKTLLLAWREAKNTTEVLEAAKQIATAEKNRQWRVANPEIQLIREVLRSSYPVGDPMVEAVFKGSHRYRDVATEDGTTQKQRRDATDESAEVQEWLDQMERLESLPQSYKQTLLDHGFTPERLNEVSAKIADCERAYEALAIAVSNRRAGTLNVLIKWREVSRWYRSAARVIRQGLKVFDPNDRLKLQQMLALPQKGRASAAIEPEIESGQGSDDQGQGSGGEPDSGDPPGSVNKPESEIPIAS